MSEQLELLSSAAITSAPAQSEYPYLPASNPETFAHVLHSLQTRTLSSPIYAFLLRPLVLIHASPGLIVARLPLEPNHMNSGGSIHGGVGATIVDWAGGMSIASYDLRGGTGVSVDINVTYLSGAKVGETVEIEGKAERVGGNVAFTSVSIFKVENGTRGRPMVLGRHTKFVGSGRKKTEDTNVSK
jgi:acyl-coenzyme A thioesterase 13